MPIDKSTSTDTEPFAVPDAFVQSRLYVFSEAIVSVILWLPETGFGPVHEPPARQETASTVTHDRLNAVPVRATVGAVNEVNAGELITSAMLFHVVALQYSSMFEVLL